ncbi:cupredoxin family protein [Hyphomicrobium sp.]|uniref:cupredoxin domain-containing protein n=1 Tax=Hyphomicrobium sp. TaxID=82 RepID=UPI001D392B29|nr:cupredoxin family protein [Hyphomicrobium sp.]MBY0560068.1 cupredoxin family protein [Hyphomicrobium sp.]
MLRTLRVLAAAAFSVALTFGYMPSMLPHAMAHEGADDDDYAAGEPGDATKPFRVVEITMRESDGAMTYSPDSVDVKQGEQIKFIVKNTGALKHEFFLDSEQHNAHHKLEMQKNPEMEHDDPNAQSIEPGKQVEILWKFSKAGTFEFACLIPGHYEAGMHGKVVVK